MPGIWNRFDYPSKRYWILTHRVLRGVRFPLPPQIDTPRIRGGHNPSQSDYQNADDVHGDVDLESRLLSKCTGVEMNASDLEKAGEKVFNLERAVAVRLGRNRSVDEPLEPQIGRNIVKRMSASCVEKPDDSLDAYPIHCSNGLSPGSGEASILGLCHDNETSE